MHKLGFYKISLYGKILICFNLHITEHWTPLHQTSHIFLILLLNWVIFMVLEVLGGGLHMFFELHKLKNNMWGFDLLWILKCSFIDLSTLMRSKQVLLFSLTSCGTCTKKTRGYFLLFNFINFFLNSIFSFHVILFFLIIF